MSYAVALAQPCPLGYIHPTVEKPCIIFEAIHKTQVLTNGEISEDKFKMNTLKNTRDYQFVIFPASQAIEKLLKACLIEKKLQHTESTLQGIHNKLIREYGHKLFYIIETLECYLENTSNIVDQVEKIPYSREIFINKPVKNPRYDPIPITSEEAVKTIDAALSIFELISDKFVISL
ncbi:HEPN domain-containing protein [Nodularia chucula]|uniref:HEPN domain-containing protein n=1 Tax=Nodularia chucula TaxID=3093667 RepID=UPI0039C6BE3D